MDAYPVSLLCTALERSGQEQWTTHKPSNAESRTAMSLVQFRRSMLKYEWASGLQELRAQNGTPATLSHQLTESWEAEWHCQLRRVAVSAVISDLSLVLPDILRDAWTDCLRGQAVQIRAPESFWEHPIARPFELCRVSVCI